MVNIDFTEENNQNNGIYEQKINVRQEPIKIQPAASGVTSVNGMDGDVVLTAQDVGALPDTTVIPTKTSELDNDSNFATTSDISSAVGDEATARENADINLQSQIDAITVSSDVTDVVGTKAALNNYDTSTLKDNDIIKVLQDESQNEETTYYRWSTQSEAFTLIGEEGPYYTKSETNTLLSTKQNSLTAGTGIDITSNTISVDTTAVQEKLTAGSNVSISDENVISATDTTYSNFIGTDGTATGTAGLVPAPATTDAGKFLKADGTWDTAGGGGPSVVQTTGSSTTDVMSQDATTKMIYSTNNISTAGINIGQNNYNNGGSGTARAITIGDSASSGNYNNTIAIGTNKNNTLNYSARAGGVNAIAIGSNGVIANGDSAIAIGTNDVQGSGANAIAIGASAKSTSQRTVAIGMSASAGGFYSVALGSNSSTTRNSTVAVGDGGSTPAIATRYIANVRDPQEAQDAATKNYVDTKILISDSAPSTSTVGVLGQLYTDTSTMHTYQCTDTTGGVYTWTQRW